MTRPRPAPPPSHSFFSPCCFTVCTRSCAVYYCTCANVPEFLCCSWTYLRACTHMPTRAEIMSKRYMLKLVLVGDAGVGKTSILRRFCAWPVNERQESTIGVDVVTKTLQAGEAGVFKLQIWDTAGQEAFRCITRAYYRDVDCALIVYDATRPSTFRSTLTWLHELRDASPQAVVMLVGNKSDGERRVTAQEGSGMASQHGMLFAETSSTREDGGGGVPQAFEACVQHLASKIESGEARRPREVSVVECGAHQRGRGVTVDDDAGCPPALDVVVCQLTPRGTRSRCC